MELKGIPGEAFKMSTTLFKEYAALHKEYTEKYGPKTAIFLMVGSFYELYDTQAPDGRTNLNVREIADFLGITLSIKRSEDPGEVDGIVAGFPDYVLHKWAGKLTGAGWTVVIVDQVKDREGRVTQRKVSRILSPSTHLEALSTYDAPTIVGVWLQFPSYAAAAFDLSTGSTYTTSGTLRGTAEAWTCDELLHFLSVFSPREVLVLSGTAASPETLQKQLDYTRPNALLHSKSQSMGALELPLARAEFLRRLYAPKSILPIIEYLQLENVLEEKVLCATLRFIEDHFPSSFERLQPNQPWSPSHLLLLGNHALNQLQIIGGGDECVLGLFKYTATTPFGKRALIERLLMPSADAAVIRSRLADVRIFYDLDTTLTSQLYKALRAIYDLPRLHRKMLCATVGAAELLALKSSYEAAATLTDLLSKSPFAASADLTSALNTLRAALTTNFDLERAANMDPNHTFLPVAAHKHLGELEDRIAKHITELDTYLNVLASAAGTTANSALRYEARERQPFGIRGTRTVLTTFKAALGTPAGDRALQKLSDEQRAVTVSIQKGGGWIESDWLTKKNGAILALQEQLEREFLLALPDVCAAFCAATQEFWQPVETWLARVDISLGLATEAKSRRWCEPTITDADSAAFNAVGLRHPLIEGLMTRVEYVAHNVQLGGETAGGWLVYGMNASGKSSLMKSIGIAVHLAQAGSFVPATSFELAPYRALFTRILNQDNLWAGLSSFAVEMSEMRDILRSADRYTLVLGDELCAGTESVSAKALVAAGIEWLAERRANFVFATHLHGLCDVLPAPDTISLKVWHLKVVYNPGTQKLVYERHLTPGSGSSLYGLEVARAMNVPHAFLEKAHAIRRKLLGTVSEEGASRSTWNSNITRRKCELCNCDVVGQLEVHHIQQRADGGTNDARNLMVLCAACHDKHHANPETSAASQPLRVTSDGLERIVANATVGGGPTPAAVVGVESPTATSSSPKKSNRGRWTDEEMTIIQQTLASYPNLPMRQLVHRLKHNDGIDISEATLRKMRGA